MVLTEPTEGGRSPNGLVQKALWGAIVLLSGCAVDSGWIELTAGPAMTCGLRFDGYPVCWGRDYPQVGDDPAPGLPDAPNEPLVAISTAGFESVGLRADGSVLGWPAGWEAPPGRFVSAEAGARFHCGLRAEGVSTCWGRTDDLAWSESEEFVEIAVGGWTVCGRRANGEVTCATLDDLPVAEAPAGPFIDIAVSASFTSEACGLRPEGTLVCWRAERPLLEFGGEWTTLDMGADSVCVLDGSGEGQCWTGLYDGGEAQPVPSGVTFDKIESGGGHGCGLTRDRDILCWGEGVGAEIPPPRPE